MTRHRSTNPSRYYERQQLDHDTRLVHWDHPTWIERNGEAIVAALGAFVLLFALACIAYAIIAPRVVGS